MILLTYQRSGSSFLGQIFNRNPEAFYAFEPLDGLYSAIYGTSQGYNAPSDIVQYWDGTQRYVVVVIVVVIAATSAAAYAAAAVAYYP